MSARDEVPPIWTTGTTEVIKTGSWRASLARHVRAHAPCHIACPVNGDIPEWIGHARARDPRAAWQILMRHNPFPAISGRVCHHPCETACNRAAYDEPLSICRLERHAGDAALANGWRLPPPAVERKERVAVVGGGPSGLSAAYQLRRSGYAVTLVEARSTLGGVMRDGIPAYRLPRDVLDGEIDRIVALGVDVRCGEALGSEAGFAHLRESYDAVYLALGAGTPKRLPHVDYARPWALDGAEYLARANGGAPPRLGPRIVVIGGGSAAIDAARTARRAGHAVTLVALEDANALPAHAEEVAQAREEGIVLHGNSMLTDVTEAGGALALVCVRVRFEPGDARRRFVASPLPGSEFPLAADAIVTAIGQDPDLSPLPASLARAGALVAVDARQATALEGVYAGGDVASMARFVTEAIGMGKRAAIEIDRVLRAGARPAPRPQDGLLNVPSYDAYTATFESINTFYYPHEARTVEPALAPADRLATGGEVMQGLAPDDAVAEAGRCFSCGTCTSCDNCVRYCPDVAVQHLADGYTVLADYCKGCGLCVEECPTGSMTMVEDRR